MAASEKAQGPGSVTVLTGGVGGAKLTAGLAELLPGSDLTAVVNTADDFECYGLHISPDVDTVLYRLAGVVDPDQGWGRKAETERVRRALEGLGEEPWFFLGDQDLALHLIRRRDLSAGQTLTEVTGSLARRLGVKATVLPMTDARVRTKIHTDGGTVDFQAWFVRDRCQPKAVGLHYAGVETARPSAAVLNAIRTADTIVVAPSNPFLSIGPILALDGILETLAGSHAPVVAVSPIVGGRAVKGPTADMLRRFAGQSTSLVVAQHYVDFLNGFLIDTADADEAADIEALGIRTRVTDTLMTDAQAQRRLAAEVLDAAEQIASADLGGGRDSRGAARGRGSATASGSDTGQEDDIGSDPA